MNHIPYTLNVGGRLLSLSQPLVMGIVNVTPDSFYAASRTPSVEQILQRTRRILDEGAAIIDMGAYSSRPGAENVSPQEEMNRLRLGLSAVRKEHPEAIISVDTFRADVARMAVEEFGVQIINDISGGELDEQMFPTVARLGVSYILMHMRGTPQTMQAEPHYDDLMAEVTLYFAQKIEQLHELGVADIILDPGFGFAKTLNHNYELLHHMQELQTFGLPLLVGVSRKSMIYKLVGGTPFEALNGTSVINTLALLKGANILRVHDVKAAVEVCQIVEKTLQS